MSTAFTPKSLDASTRPVHLRVGTLLDGTAVRKNVHLVYDAKGIRHVGDAPGEPDEVLSDWTVLPALIDAHTHLFLEGHPVDAEKRVRTRPDLNGARERLRRVGLMGLAAVRDAGDKHGIGLALQKEAVLLDSPGAAINREGRYGGFFAEPCEGSAEACVEGRFRRGARRIKVIASGIINFAKGAVTAPPQMTGPEIAALSAAARARGMQPFAHASGEAGIQCAIDGGVATIEHGFFITRDQLATMRDRGIAWVPTFTPVQVQIDRAGEIGWDDQVVSNLKRIIEGHVEALRHALEIGVTILAGSDAGSCGVPHGFGLFSELESLERAGMSPLDALNAATGTNGSFLGFPAGRIVPGAPARLILTRHSPLETVANLRKPRIVLLDGRAHEAGGESPEEL